MNTKNFKITELACSHCGEVKLNSELLAVLELVRHHFNAPVIINSGYRCETHNEKIGGARHSKHLHGIAADIVVKGVNAHEVYEFLNGVFPNSYGLGRYDSFVHIDVRASKGRW